MYFLSIIFINYFILYFLPYQGHTIDDIPSAVLDDCAHLVKANSIQGTVHVTCLYIASL